MSSRDPRKTPRVGDAFEDKCNHMLIEVSSVDRKHVWCLCTQMVLTAKVDWGTRMSHMEVIRYGQD
jgi:hypothetical protein